MVRLVFTVMPGNVIFEFASNYIRAGVPPSALYISPGQHSVSSLKDLPAAAVYTCGFECLRDVDVEFASNWKRLAFRSPGTNTKPCAMGFLQMAPWISTAMKALLQVAQDLRDTIKSGQK